MTELAVARRPEPKRAKLALGAALGARHDDRVRSAARHLYTPRAQAQHGAGRLRVAQAGLAALAELVPPPGQALPGSSHCRRVGFAARHAYNRCSAWKSKRPRHAFRRRDADVRNA